MADLRWQSYGGLLVDSTGDIAMTSDTTPAGRWEELATMVATRVKAALNSWQLYAIGADLDSLPGKAPPSELELAVKQSITYALSNDFMPSGSFTVNTLSQGSEITIFIFVQNQLLYSTVFNF